MVNEIPRNPNATINTNPENSNKNCNALALKDRLLIFKEYIGKLETSKNEKSAIPTI